MSSFPSHSLICVFFLSNCKNTLPFSSSCHLYASFKMHFKLSARELEILDKDRVSILTKLRESHLASKQAQSCNRRPMKPPILVVPLDSSRLISIVQSCNDFVGSRQPSSEDLTKAKPVESTLINNEVASGHFYDQSLKVFFFFGEGRLSVPSMISHWRAVSESPMTRRVPFDAGFTIFED